VEEIGQIELGFATGGSAVNQRQCRFFVSPRREQMEVDKVKIGFFFPQTWGWPSKMKRGWTASESKHRRCQTAIYTLANSALAGRKHGNQLHRSLEWRLREIGKGENTAVGRTMRSRHVPRTTY